MDAAEDVQFTAPVMLSAEPSLYVPVATKAAVAPNGMVALAGVTVMDSRIAVLVATVVWPLMPVAGSVAETTALPWPAAVT